MGSDEGDNESQMTPQEAADVFNSNSTSARMWTGLIVVFGFLEAITLGLLIGLWSFWFVDYIDERTPPAANIVTPSYAWTCFMSIPHVLHIATVVFSVALVFINRTYLKSTVENKSNHYDANSKYKKARTYKTIITVYFSFQIINIVGGLIAVIVKLCIEGPSTYAPHNISILGNDGQDDQTSVAQVYSFAISIIALILAVFQSAWSGVLFTMPLAKMEAAAKKMKQNGGGQSGEQQPVDKSEVDASGNPSSKSNAFYNGSTHAASGHMNRKYFGTSKAPQNYNRMETENFANVSYNQFNPSSSPYGADDNFSMAVFK